MVEADPIQSDYAPRGAPFTGRKFLIIIVLFFLVIIGANMAMLYAALQSWGGLVVKNSYIASQSFNADSARSAAQPIRQWAVAFDAAEDGLRVVVQDASGAAVEGLGLSAVVGRPTHEREDVALSFQAVGGGVYRADHVLAPGAWRAQLTVQSAEGAAQRRSFEFLAPARATGAPG